MSSAAMLIKVSLIGCTAEAEPLIETSCAVKSPLTVPFKSLKDKTEAFPSS